MKSLKIPNWTRKIEWSDYKDLKNSPSDKFRTISNLAPQKNEFRIVYVPEKTVTTELFYGIFEPALSFFNGWDEFPEKIDLHRIYKAQIIETLFEDEHGKWIKVRIIESKKLFEVAFLDSHSSTDVFIKNYQPDYYFEYQKWLFVSFNAESDLGYDFLFYKDGEYFILVYQCEWGFSDEKTFIHNIKCKKETVQSWIINLL